MRHASGPAEGGKVNEDISARVRFDGILYAALHRDGHPPLARKTPSGSHLGCLAARRMPLTGSRGLHEDPALMSKCMKLAAVARSPLLCQRTPTPPL